MTQVKNSLMIALCFLLLAIMPDNLWAAENAPSVTSPDGKIRVTFSLEQGVPTYAVSRARQEIIKPSKLGFVFKDDPSLSQNLAMTRVERRSFDETWEQPWGEVRQIRNHYNELRVYLQETVPAKRQMNLVFRVYDDGLGFRYEVPAQPNLTDIEIMAEETEFALSGDYQAWWIPAFQDKSYEYLYTKSPVSQLKTVHTPLTLETTDGLFLSIHEAALVDYAAMTLAGAGDATLRCDLVPWSDGIKVKISTPFQTPWRTIQMADSAGDLITSYLILNLNEPNKLDDVSWVQPGKYVGIWWGMHTGLYTWGRGPRHGATTERTKSYLDFAAKYGFTGVLVEGWNYGWDGAWWAGKTSFDFTRPYKDFDIEVVSRYAQDKGVRLIGHHETGGDVANYEHQLENAFDFYEKLGITIVKTGYAGRRINQTEWHDGQLMVWHSLKVIEMAAEHQMMLDVHEPVKDTGLRRTYPNLLTSEGARGTEYDAKIAAESNPPEHTTILPFTRLLAGPLDFTPGIFDLLDKEDQLTNHVNTTLAKQLALYVVIYSPLQMVADLPENYENQPAFQFIVDVPVDWQDTRVLNAQIGDYVTLARQDRHSDDWYIGSITDENGRTLTAPLTFLKTDQKYVAEIYADAPDANWASNPLALNISKVLVDRDTTLRFTLAPGGGQAIRLRPATAADIEASGNGTD